MNRPTIVSRAEWLEARKALLVKEKALSHARDALSAARRELPAEKVEKPYVFEGVAGEQTLADLFAGKRQLVIYHFMFDPSWEQGCKSCSFVADHFGGMLPHLRARDVSFAAVSRAPLAKLTAFQKRMGWTFRWLSSSGSDFNFDFGVSFREPAPDGQKVYNYGTTSFAMSEAPGLSVFLRDGEDVLHAYSTYARGLDPLITTYGFLDLTPLGRQEEGLPYGMAWVKHHDRYEDA